jgi:hypothetical protein
LGSPLSHPDAQSTAKDGMASSAVGNPNSAQ